MLVQTYFCSNDISGPMLQPLMCYTPKRVYQCSQLAHLITLITAGVGTLSTWEGWVTPRRDLGPPSGLCQLSVLMLNQILQLCCNLSPVKHDIEVDSQQCNPDNSDVVDQQV